MTKESVKTCIVGIGTPFRGDDGIGWAVIDALEGKESSKIHLYKRRGDLGEFLDLFEQYSIVYVVDACRTHAALGSVKRLDALMEPLPQDSLHTSTHGFGLTQAIELAGAVQQLPSKLIVYAISGGNFQMNDSLSPEVAQAVSVVADAIMYELC